MKCESNVIGLFSLIISFLLISGCSDTGQKNKNYLSEKEKEDVINSFEIYQFSNPKHHDVLCQPTKPIRKLPSKEVDSFILVMIKAMKENQGVGISANQLGKPWQLFVINPFLYPKPGNNIVPYKVYINPVIEKNSEERVCFWHGCLSAKADKMGKVATWKNITISAFDQKGQRFSEELTGIEAIIVQHEFRHILGGSYQDHAYDFEDELTLARKMLQGHERMFELCDLEKPLLLSDYRVGQTVTDYLMMKNEGNELKEKSFLYLLNDWIYSVHIFVSKLICTMFNCLN